MFGSIATVTQDGHEAKEVSVADHAEVSVAGPFDPATEQGEHGDWVSGLCLGFVAANEDDA